MGNHTIQFIKVHRPGTHPGHTADAPLCAALRVTRLPLRKRSHPLEITRISARWHTRPIGFSAGASWCDCRHTWAMADSQTARSPDVHPGHAYGRHAPVRRVRTIRAVGSLALFVTFNEQSPDQIGPCVPDQIGPYPTSALVVCFLSCTGTADARVRDIAPDQIGPYCVHPDLPQFTKRPDQIGYRASLACLPFGEAP